MTPSLTPFFTPFWALVRKEATVLFASPVAYFVLTIVALLTSITFFEHLRLYNHQLFLYASSSMGGFESDTIPDYINLRDTVFLPVMEQLGLLILLPIPLVTMRVFAEERSLGTDELLLTSFLSPAQIVLAKFGVTFGFVVLMMTISFIYPASAVISGGLGLQHLLAVYLGLVMLGLAIASIGLACSAFTSSQVIAAVSTVGLTFLLYDFGWTFAFVSEETAAVLEEISLHPHFGRFSEGLVALADVVYFAVVAVIAAALVRLSLDLRRVGG
jgi:ABC-2 type transport system permease protein